MTAEQRDTELADMQNAVPDREYVVIEQDEDGHARGVVGTRRMARTGVAARAALAAGQSPTAHLPCRTATVAGSLDVMRDLNRTAMQIAGTADEIRVLIELGNAISRAIALHRECAK